MSPIFVGGRRILGALSADPTTGLSAGDEYYNTTDGVKKLYNGTSWNVVGDGNGGYPILSVFTDSTNGRYDARVWLPGNSFLGYDFTVSNASTAITTSSNNITIDTSTARPSGAPAVETGSFSIPNAGTEWIDGFTSQWSSGNVRTLCMWIKTTETSCHLMHTQSSGDMPMVSGNLRWHPASSNFGDSNGVTINDNNWHHIVGIQTGTDRYWYIDGTLVQNTLNNTGNPDTAAWTGANNITFFGSRGSTSNRGQFGGLARGIRLYDNVLSQSQVTALYTNGL